MKRHDLSSHRNGDFLWGLRSDVQADGTDDLVEQRLRHTLFPRRLLKGLPFRTTSNHTDARMVLAVQCNICLIEQLKQAEQAFLVLCSVVSEQQDVREATQR